MTTVPAGAWSELGDSKDLQIAIPATAVAVLLGAMAASVGLLVPIGIAGVLLFVVVAVRPVVAAYTYLLVMPFVTGIDRGAWIPLIRPQEALFAVLGAAVLAGWAVRAIRGEQTRVHVRRIDVALVLLAVAGSLWPLLWLLIRGISPGTEDLLSVFPLWKYAALYALFRAVVRTREQVRRCLWLLLAASAVVALVAAFQSLGLFGFDELVKRIYPPESATVSGRGTATLGSSIAVGDLVLVSLAVVLGWWDRARSDRLALAVVAVALGLGLLGTGQFSAWIGAVLVLGTSAVFEQRVRRTLAVAVPAAGVAILIGWPIIAARLASFVPGAGLPQSWLGRIDNLSTFYLPELGGFRFLLGVRPDSILEAPETWRETIYLESGYLWFLWVGGVPLLLAFIWFVRRTWTFARATARARHDEVAVASAAVVTIVPALVFLTIFDMHLTLRGGADAMFVVLALAANRHVRAEEV